MIFMFLARKISDINLLGVFVTLVKLKQNESADILKVLSGS